ncbi:predicted protein [Plenodomus lingam JN3]|uniref:Predicted protein n=1 Tax=Leptosphaeria maculans (strain JN3 / isolate v23.1.3 / race Av1-4-5-6-7-8) TaxID=985895 RepID=E5ABK6_LEPMJ|nr:predicted protein [Plenodomus lingam JN3]CBY01047.1 predicted protein [Plenodomus lingam JN3]
MQRHREYGPLVQAYTLIKSFLDTLPDDTYSRIYSHMTAHEQTPSIDPHQPFHHSHNHKTSKDVLLRLPRPHLQSSGERHGPRATFSMYTVLAQHRIPART